MIAAAFFSYSREDSVFVLRLSRDLRSAGAGVWIDQLDIEPGVPWDRRVEEALNDCPWVILVLSPSSVESENVRDEVSFALNKQKKIIPILYRKCDVPYRLARLQQIDFSSDYAYGLAILLRALRLGVEDRSIASVAETPASSSTFPGDLEPNPQPQIPSGEHAQDGRGIKRPPKELRIVSVLTVARIRALCAGDMGTGSRAQRLWRLLAGRRNWVISATVLAALLLLAVELLPVWGIHWLIGYSSFPKNSAEAYPARPTEVPTAANLVKPLTPQDALSLRCLALTGAFETGLKYPLQFGNPRGDWDHASVLSLGVLGWSFGQETLQPLLKSMWDQHPDEVRSALGENTYAFAEMLGKPLGPQFLWAHSIQAGDTISQPWSDDLQALATSPSFIALQVSSTKRQFSRALELAQEFGLWSERGVALLFDAVIQRGDVRTLSRNQIVADLGKLPTTLARADTEIARMRIVANRCAETANPRYVEEVRSRLLTIANGSGIVHTISYDVGRDFAIRLQSHR